VDSAAIESGWISKRCKLRSMSIRANVPGHKNSFLLVNGMGEQVMAKSLTLRNECARFVNLWAKYSIIIKAVSGVNYINFEMFYGGLAPSYYFV
jgi:hypothetical protein